MVGMRGGTTTVQIPILPLGAAEALPMTPLPDVPYWGTQRMFGLGVGVVGLAAIVVGSIYGVKAANKDAATLPHCQPDNKKLCDAQGVALGEEAFEAAALSTVGFVAGGVGLVGGTILFLTAPSGPAKRATGWRRFEASPMVGVGVGGFSVRGVW